MSKEYVEMLEERLGVLKTSELELKHQVNDLREKLDKEQHEVRELRIKNSNYVDDSRKMQQTINSQQEQIMNLQKQIAIYEKMDFRKEVKEVKEVKPSKDYEKRETFKTKQTFKLVNKLIWIVGIILFICFGSEESISNFLTLVVILVALGLVLFVFVGIPILFVLWKTGKLVFKKVSKEE